MEAESSNDKGDDDNHGPLIERMIGAARFTPDGRAAFGELMQEFEPGLRGHVLKLYRWAVRGNDDLLAEFIQDVFVHFWKHGLKSFDLKFVTSGACGAGKVVRVWLAESAKYVSKGWLSRNKCAFQIKLGATSVELRDVFAARAPLIMEADELPPDVGYRSPEEKAFFELTVRERDLLLAFYRYYNAAAEQCRVNDRDVKASICKDFGFVKWDAARKAKERAEDRLLANYERHRRGEVA